MKKKRLYESFFYSKQAKTLSIGDFLSLEEEESNHLTKVFRAKEGDFFQLADGRGRLFHAQLKEIQRKNHTILLKELIQSENHAHSMHIKIGFLKGKDLEDVIDTCSQVNLSSIQPLWTQHTQESASKDHSKLLQRLRTKAITGLKQSKSLWLTDILEPIRIEDAILKEENSTLIHDDPASLVQLVLDMKGNAHLDDSLSYQIRQVGANLWIGPEGGLSSLEINKLLALPRSHSLSVGGHRLRAKTAPIFILGYLSGQLNR